MAINEQAYRELLEEVEEAKANAERAAGALEQLMSSLEEDFDCDSLKAAEERLETLRKKRDAATVAFESAMKKYTKKWKNGL